MGGPSGKQTFAQSIAKRRANKEKKRKENQKTHREMQNTDRSKRAAKVARETVTARVQNQVTRADMILAETKQVLQEIKKNYTAGAGALAENYGVLIEDELGIARGDEAHELRSADADLKILAAAYTRQSKSRQFLLTLGPKIFAALAVDPDGAKRVDPMIEAAQRIAQHHEGGGEVELVRETVILKASTEEVIDGESRVIEPAISASGG